MMMRTSTDRPPCKPDPQRGHHCPPHHQGIGFASSAYFSDVYTHISDPSVFTVPSYCKKDASTAQYGDDRLPTILERFIVL